jgi:hypothetical protein
MVGYQVKEGCVSKEDGRLLVVARAIMHFTPDGFVLFFKSDNRPASIIHTNQQSLIIQSYLHRRNLVEQFLLEDEDAIKKENLALSIWKELDLVQLKFVLEEVTKIRLSQTKRKIQIKVGAFV